jgi:hypothetical protein
MRVIYAGGPLCAEMTFKRLVLLANEVGFSDRPSVGFDKWGTVGIQTPIRSVASAAGQPIKFVIHQPPSGPVAEVFAKFVPSDVRDLAVRRLFLEGLREDPIFRERYVKAAADYGGVSGAQVVSSLLSDPTLSEADLGEVTGFCETFQISSMQGRRDTLRTLLVEMSIHVTTALLGGEELGLVPVTDDPYLAQLLALRVGSGQPKPSSATVTAILDLEIVRSVIPDHALARVEIPDLLQFRKKTSDVYAAWGAEVERLGALLDDAKGDASVAEYAQRLVATEIRPKMDAMRAELASARDSMFGDVVKSATDWKLPALALAVLHHSPLLGAAVGVLGSALAGTVKATADHWAKKRGTVRKHGVAYLVQLADHVGSE